MKRNVLLTQRLVEDGCCAGPKEAASLVMAGQVYVNGQQARAGARVVPEDQLIVAGANARYVGKGGLKLEHALQAFAIPVAGRVCLDAGASTGGFTDCLVKAGAARVYAVEVGFGQLMGSLRQHPAVVNLEKTNLSAPQLLALDPGPTLGVCDLSYLSLRLGVPYYRAILHGLGEAVCLVKPLFEVDDAAARRTGQITQDAYAPLLHGLIAALNGQEDTAVCGVTHSPVRGNGGTLEFFLHVRFGASIPPPALAGEVSASVEAALALSDFRKT